MKTNTIVKIDLGKVHADKRNFFETSGSIEIEQSNAELKDSIEEDGLIHPIVVRPDPEHDDEYIIISGHRRMKMFQRLQGEGKEEFCKIPAVIKNIQDGPKVRLMLLEANITQRESTDWEKAQAVKEYGEILDELKASGTAMPGRRRDHIADRLHISKTQVGQYEKINKNLAPEFKEEMKAGNIGVSVADKLASLPEEKQKEIHEENPTPKMSEITPEDKSQTAQKDYWIKTEEMIIPKKYKFKATIKIKMPLDMENGKYYFGYTFQFETGHFQGMPMGKTPYDSFSAAMKAAYASMAQSEDAKAVLLDLGYDVGEQAEKQMPEPKKKRTGEAYENALQKMNENKDGFGGLEPCEQCTVASCCDMCCKTCQEPCGSKQECRKDNEAEAELKIYAIQKVVKKLEGMVSTSRGMAGTYEGESQEQVDQYEAIARYAEELIEKAKKDLFDLQG